MGGQQIVGMTGHEWGVFATFVMVLVGIAFVSPRLASVVGVAAILIMGTQAVVGGKVVSA